ncbi:uncharacterized protein PV09_02866 [Verruconis gallopava]|uniref:A to I editase domain-containing protein n=1 Tax=Verruconis gallopava TaxID=253628 RepID=A0A0D2AIP3_9PEZI|nr:uncharacterized protein PV09_02866 [Verruconis gallopava]KIW06415.1 hypothetical protein PV09_02866 [Verruconis gallopava]
MEGSQLLEAGLPRGDDIAACVLSKYDELPQKCKPRVRGEGSREWVPLAGIVLSSNNHGRQLECVAVGTGMKCLPASKLADAHGTVLHDSHAEVIAVRSFNRFLLEQCLQLANDPTSTSLYVRRRSPCDATSGTLQPFEIRQDVSIHMYGSEAPCGDASMELIMAAQEDATPWAIPPVSDMDGTSSDPVALKGRGSFGELGIVRRKPSRSDAPDTLSKSCTDKLTMYQYMSLLNSVTSLFVAPGNAYLSSFTIPKSQFIESAFVRAFTTSGRLKDVKFTGDVPYVFKPFAVQTTDLEFQWSRRAAVADGKAIPSNVSAAYTVYSTEALIGGVLQGRKNSDPRGACAICRKSLWKIAAELANLLDEDLLDSALKVSSYGEIKGSELLALRRRMKNELKTQNLKGWVPNVGDESFHLL